MIAASKPGISSFVSHKADTSDRCDTPSVAAGAQGWPGCMIQFPKAVPVPVRIRLGLTLCREKEASQLDNMDA